MTAAWDKAIARAESKHRARDLKRLTELVDHDFELTEWEREAFPGMLDALKSGQDELTVRQREYVFAAIQRLDLEIEYVNLASAGAPRGREVELMVKDKPLKPPGRRESL